MKELQPKGYALEQALRWISEERKAHSGKKVQTLIHEAARKFDLGPKDEEFLLRQLRSESD